MRGDDDVPDLHAVRLAAQQAPIPAPGLLLMLVEGRPVIAELDEQTQILISSPAPALPQSALLELGPDELGELLVGPDDPIASHDGTASEAADRRLNPARMTLAIICRRSARNW
jgi:hypothetical protein